ncbi:MAG: rRNA adenine dimethyltransferase family protein, partial [Patescibacteria group bacterium]
MGHIAQRRFGQNFLIDRNIAKKIVKQALIEPNETVIEIGPGQGAITVLLSEQAKKVIAIELDRNLIQGLQHLAGEHSNVSIIEGDALKCYQSVVNEIGKKPYLVVANIPYNITSAIIRTILTTTPPASRAVL